MSERFRFRTPIYRVDGKFKRFEFWHCEDGFLEVARTLLVDDNATFGTSEQCTGLKDKNGRMIYEGDIVKRHSKYSEDEKDVVLQVEWNRKGARYITTDKKHDSWIFSMFDYEYEILGNIHENPELLEGKK